MNRYTASVPKALIHVAGQPFLAWQLLWLASQHVTRVVLLVGHLGEAVEAFVGDGNRWGLDVRYGWERDGLLGTAGAIRRAADSGLLEDEFFVMYGDSYLQVDLSAIQDHFRRSSSRALMTVFRNDNQWDRSNAVVRDNHIVLYDKEAGSVRGPRPAGMVFIDYGLLVLTRGLVLERIPSGQPADLAPVLKDLSRRRELAAYEAPERFYEIGSAEGLEELCAQLPMIRGGSPQRPYHSPDDRA